MARGNGAGSGNPEVSRVNPHAGTRPGPNPCSAVHVRDVTVPLTRLSEAGLGVEAERTGKATDSEKAWEVGQEQGGERGRPGSDSRAKEGWPPVPTVSRTPLPRAGGPSVP